MIDIEFIKKENRVVAYDEKIEIGECSFIESEDIWNIIHTEVDSKYQGQGIAKKLVITVIENAKIYNKKVMAECFYAKKIIENIKE